MSQTVLIIIAVVVFVVLISIALSIASFSSERFLQAYEKYNKMPVYEEMTILDFIHTLIYKKLDGKIAVKTSKEDVENFYSPSAKVVALSKRTLSSNTIASFAIVAHEMGHALQDKEGSKLKKLNFLRRFGSFLGFLFLPSLITGIILFFLGEDLRLFSYVLLGTASGILLLAILIKMRTISIEKDASNKGIEFLKEFLIEDEVSECKKLLNIARLTYWGDLFRLLLSWTMLTRKTKMFR